MKKLIYLALIILIATFANAASFTETDVTIEQIGFIATGNNDVPYKVVVIGVTKDAAGNQLRTFGHDVYDDLSGAQKTTVANIFATATTKAKTKLGIP